jgi:hypothetical protein
MIERQAVGRLVIRDVLLFHSGVIDESILLRHDSASLGKQFPCFGRSPV